MKPLVGVLVVAGAATICDAVWYTFGIEHTLTAGLVHGAVLLTVTGAVLGAANGTMLKGLPIGTIAGIGGAFSYYALVAATDGRTYGSAIPAAWVIMWLILAALEGRWLRAPARRPWPGVAARGVAAATLGGFAFYLVMNTLWGPPPGGGRSYTLQFLAWAFAWAPGILVLSFGNASRASPSIRTTTASHEPRSEGPSVASAVTTPIELLACIDRGDALHILDVRTESEFASGHVPGATNIPFTQLPFRMNDVPGSEEDSLILYCGHGPRAHIAAMALHRGGRTRIVYLEGHWAAWRAAGLRVER